MITSPRKKLSFKSSKLAHTNRYEPLSDDYQAKLHSPVDKTHSLHSKESKKTSKKPSLLKEAVQQVQQDHNNPYINMASPSPNKDLNKHKEDNQLTRLSPKKITQETLALENLEEQILTETDEDNTTNNNTKKSQKGTNKHQESDSTIDSEPQEHSITNPYAKGKDPQAMARRQAAHQCKEEINREILEENKKESEAAKKAYKEARGAPDPSLEEKDNRKRQSVSFSISKEDDLVTLKDNQI